ncbi:MAG: TIGR03663 family protein [Herpetosiphonaceae bacterium]|nr:TIGR03663 family protein [Herpetosiphonaceae bacterium]
MTTPDITRSRIRRRLRPGRPAPQSRGLLAQPLTLDWLNTELLGYVGLVLLSMVLHLWMLGNMAMHHDESIHAYSSWRFYAGKGGFSCGLNNAQANTYCYNPVFHGPTLYLLTYLSYFLFGVSDATARLPMALAGVGLVASCWMLRPLIGRRAALFSAGLMLISPTILYFTRFARHDALALLWTFWLMVGLFRFMRDRQGRWLYLAAAALALLWATHELVFIIMFIAATFLVQRLLWESISNRIFVIVSGIAMAIGGVLMLFNPTISLPTATGQAANVLHFGGMGLIIFMTLLLGQVISLRWTTTPLVRGALGYMRDNSRVFWIATAIFWLVFTVFFTTFFTYLRGFGDGLVAGLSYWLFTQHSYARGDQPWYYYFMQLGIYELLPVVLTFVGLGGWLARIAWRKAVTTSTLWDEEEDSAVVASMVETEAIDLASVDPPALITENPVVYGTTATPAAELLGDATRATPETVVSIAEVVEIAETVPDLWLGFGFYWFFLSFTVFSWAGEKMPWLTIHMTLPAVLCAGWALSRITQKIDWPAVRERWGWLIVPLVAGAVVLLITAASLLGAAAGVAQAAQQSKLGLWMLLLFVVLIGVAIWQIGKNLGRSTTLRMVALGLVGMLGLYTVRSSVNAVYYQPDVPVEFMVYTQTAPDVPLIMREVQQIAITQTRNTRSISDPTGGNSMKILLSGGDPTSGNSEGSLRQPLEWYLRDWTNVQWRNKDEIANLPPTDLDAPVAIFARSNMAPDTVQKMEDAGYMQAYDTFFNWWFPEGSTDGLGAYKDRLYDPAYGCDPELRGQKDVNGRALFDCTAGGVGILTWPLRPANWNTLRQYLLSRTLPDTTPISGREMAVFIRRDAAPLPSGPVGTGFGSNEPLKLVSEGALIGDSPVEPRGMATGPDGALYVADAPNNRILVYATDGTTRTISGSGPGALQEPSGVAVDPAGNVYVADTWNARIAKFGPDGTFITAWGTGEEELQAGTGKRVSRTGGTAEGNAAKPLGFFGPRNVAVDKNGHVFIADTGNKRIVVTDANGTFLGQIGTAGAAPGQFNEPIGLAVDDSGNLFVGDTWNGRVQVFAISPDGLPEATPKSSWQVPGWKPDTYLDPFLAAGSDGRVVVAIPDRSVATLYDITGRPLVTWGGEGSDEAALNRPSGVAFAPDGSVYIGEKGTQRIQRWVLPRVR